MTKEDFIYVGIDLHKETHTAVMIDCYNNKLGEITFANNTMSMMHSVTIQESQILMVQNRLSYMTN